MVYDLPQVETFITAFEGRRLKAYYDISGKLTIGIGHKCLSTDPYTISSVISDAVCDKLFQTDINLIARSLNRLVLNPNLTADQNCALLDFEFNLGMGALASSTLLKCINAGDLVSAADQFLRWDHAVVKGVMIEVDALKKRRAAERQLFTSDFAQ